MKTKKPLIAAVTLLAGLITINTELAAAPLGTAFTYQGRLDRDGAPANGLYDLQFHLSDALINGNQVVQPVTNSAVAVSNGVFTVSLDFGPGLYANQSMWLWISVRTNGTGDFTDLTPRQPLTPAPFALYAPNAGAASTAVVASSVEPGGITSEAIQTGAVTANSIADGTILAADLSSILASSTFWRMDGNANTGGSQFLGTTDNQPVNFNVNNHRVLRLDPGTNGVPNILAGYELNRITPGVKGATIAGGGGPSQWNAITNGDFGTIGGGHINTVGADHGTVAGGMQNSATGDYAAVGGGGVNKATGFANVVGGGFANTAGGVYSFIGGGSGNTNGATCAATAGGSANTNYSPYGSIGGGRNNFVENLSSTIPGGAENTASGSYAFAAGQRAKALHTSAFVWADFTAADFASTDTNQFLIRASGGVGINTNNPNGAALNVNGTIVAGNFAGNGSSLTGLSGASLANGSVTATKLAAQSVTAAALSADAVNSSKILDASIATADLADSSVTATKLASDAASLNKVTAGSASMNGNRVMLNSQDLLLKDDDKHGLGYYGNSKLFGGVGLDGPVLYGYSGGGLGTVTFSATNLMLVWNNAGNVGIGVTNPAARLDISGTNDIATGVDGIVNVGNSAAAHLTLDSNKLQARNGASDTTLYLNRTGGNVAIGIGVSANPAKLDVNGDVRVRGLLRSGVANTGESPSPEGLVVRRINSTQMSTGYPIAKARTDPAFGSSADITLERDGTSGGFLIHYPAAPGNITIACMGMDSTGTPRNFYTALANPGTAGTVQIYANAANIVHFDCTFGVTFNSGQHLTQVVLSRYSGDNFWSGTLTSTYNQ